MKRLISAALRGIRAEISSPGGSWQIVSGQAPALSRGGMQSAAGQMVSAETVMGLSAVWACTAATAQLVASLPCALYERLPDGGKRRVDDPIADVVFRRPNQVQTGVEFWEGMLLRQLVEGNAYSRKLKIGGRVVGLQPLAGVVPKWTGAAFEYQCREGAGGRTYTLQADDVLHLRGFGAGDGLGMSAVRYGVQSFGSALAAERTASRVFATGMQSSGFLGSDQVLDSGQRTQLQDLLDEYAGSERAGKAMVLEGGLTWHPLQWNPEDAQLLETRRFQVEDICRWFGIPPIVIGHSADGSTMWGAGVEAVMLSWLQTGINPVLRRIEARMNRELLPDAKRRTWFFEFGREAMLQMDSKAKADFLSKMGTSGTMTANERRAKLNLPPHADPAADALLAQTALAPLDTLGKDKTDAP